MSELYCTICQKFIETDGLKLVRDFTRGGSHKGKGRGLVATFLDRKTGTAHVVLTERASEKFRPKTLSEPKVTVVKPEPPPIPALTPPVETPSPPAELRRQWQSEQAQETDSEAEELWQSEGEPWEPDEDEWYQATVTRVLKGFAFADLSNGETVFISDVAIVPERGHICLRTGDDVALRIEKSANRTSNWQALECQLQTPRVLSNSETGIIEKPSSTGFSYFVVLSCGCYMKTTADSMDPLCPGDPVVLSDFEPDRNHEGKVVAKKVRREE